MNKNLILIVMALAFASVPLMAKDKITERSAPKQPQWLTQVDRDCITASARGVDLSVAKAECLQSVRQSIVTSIASNISSAESSAMLVERNGKVENVYETYASQIVTVAGNIPYISGISLSEATDIYWEKHLETSDKSTWYECHILYPFPKSERDALVAEFVRNDREKYSALKELRKQLDEVSDISQIDRGITDATALVGYFFDDFRRIEAEAVLKAYRDSYSKISIVPVSNVPGRFVYALALDGKYITASARPTLRSETAVGMTVRAIRGSMYELVYDSSYCYPHEENHIDMGYTFGGKTLRYRVEINVDKK